jgi:hypothetical protein
MQTITVAARLDCFINFRPALGRSGRGIAFGGDKGVSRVDFSSDGGMSWHETEPKDEGNIQFPTMAGATTKHRSSRRMSMR